MSPGLVLGSTGVIIARKGSEMGAKLLFFICTSFYGHFAPQPVADRVRSVRRWCVFWIVAQCPEPGRVAFVISLRNLRPSAGSMVPCWRAFYYYRKLEQCPL